MSNIKDADTSLLERTYIQKSRIFLFPLTGIKRDRVFSPINTYVSCPDLVHDLYPTGIKDTDRILIANYPKKYRDNLATMVRKPKFASEQVNLWENYEMEQILSNPTFLAVHETSDELLYTFDLSEWKYDWDNFLRGRYSLFSKAAKEKIINFRWFILSPKEKRKMMCYLYPNKEECVQTFARQLNESVEDLRSVKELCSKPDLRQEVYRCEPIIKTEQISQ